MSMLWRNEIADGRCWKPCMLNECAEKMGVPVEGPWSRMLNGSRTGDVPISWLESRTNGQTAPNRSARVEVTKNYKPTASRNNFTHWHRRLVWRKIVVPSTDHRPIELPYVHYRLHPAPLPQLQHDTTPATSLPFSSSYPRPLHRNAGTRASPAASRICRSPRYDLSFWYCSVQS